MLLFIIFAVVGIVIGVAIVLLTRQFRGTNKSRLVVFAPSIVSIVVAVYLMYLGNVKIEGTNGAAYMLLSLILFCFGIVVVYLTDKKGTQGK